MRTNKRYLPVNNKRADNHSTRLAGYRLCVYASGSVITDVLNCFTLITVSCLHLGQYRGKFSSTVSGRTLIRVLLLQIGHNTHFSFFNAPPLYHQNKSNRQIPHPCKAAAYLCRLTLRLSIWLSITVQNSCSHKYQETYIRNRLVPVPPMFPLRFVRRIVYIVGKC